MPKAFFTETAVQTNHPMLKIGLRAGKYGNSLCANGGLTLLKPTPVVSLFDPCP